MSNLFIIFAVFSGFSAFSALACCLATGKRSMYEDYRDRQEQVEILSEMRRKKEQKMNVRRRGIFHGRHWYKNTGMVCKRCGNPVYKSDNPEYVYQCFCCDEDLYSFEVRKETEGK